MNGARRETQQAAFSQSTQQWLDGSIVLFPLWNKKFNRCQKIVVQGKETLMVPRSEVWHWRRSQLRSLNSRPQEPFLGLARKTQ